MPATTGALDDQLVSLEIRRALGAPTWSGAAFRRPRGEGKWWPSENTLYHHDQSLLCVFYYENPVSSYKNGANEPNLTKIGLSSDEKQTQTPNISWHIW